MLPPSKRVTATFVFHALTLGALGACTPSAQSTEEEQTAAVRLAQSTAPFDVRDKCLTARDRGACLREGFYKAKPNAPFFAADGARETLSYNAEETFGGLFPGGIRVDVDETQIARDERLAIWGRMSVEAVKFATGGLLSNHTIAALFGDSAKAFIDSLDATKFDDAPYVELRLKVEKLLGDVLVSFSGDLLNHKAEVKKAVFENMQLVAQRNWGRLDQRLKDKYMFMSFSMINERVAWLEGHMDDMNAWRAREDRDPKVTLDELKAFGDRIEEDFDKVHGQLVERARTDSELKAKIEGLEAQYTGEALDALDATTKAVQALPPSPEDAPAVALPELRAVTQKALAALAEQQEGVAGAVAVISLFDGEAARRLDVAYKATTSVVKGIDQIATAGASFAMLGGVGAVIAGVQMVQGLTQKDASQAMAQQLLRAIAQLSQQIQRLDDLVRAKFVEVNGKLDVLTNKLDALDARLLDEMRVLRATLEDVRSMVGRLEGAQRARHAEQMQLLRDILLAGYEGARLAIVEHFDATLDPFTPAEYTRQLSRLNEAMKVTFAKDALSGSADLFDRAAAEPTLLPAAPSRLRSRRVEHTPSDFAIGGALALAHRTRGSGPLEPPARAVNPFLWSDASQVLAYLVTSHNVFEDRDAPTAWRANLESRPLVESLLDLGLDDLRLSAHLQTNAALFTGVLDAAAAGEDAVQEAWFDQLQSALLSPYFATDVNGRFAGDARIPSDVRERHGRRLESLWSVGAGDPSRAELIARYLDGYLTRRAGAVFSDQGPTPLESSFAFPDAAADPDRLFAGAALPVLTWPGQELVGSEAEERQRYDGLQNPHLAARGVIPAAFLNAEVFGLGAVHKRYIVRALRGDNPSRGYRGFRVELLADFVPYEARAAAPLARLVYDYECVSPSPEPHNANQVGLLRGIDPRGMRLDYESSGMRFQCIMRPKLAARETLATADDTAWLEGAFQRGVFGPAARKASDAFHQPSTPASAAALRHQAASRSLTTLLQLAYPASFVEGGALALPVLARDERSLLADLPAQITRATQGLAPSLTSLGARDLQSAYRTALHAAIPGLARGNVYRDAVLGRIQATSAAVSAVLATAGTTPGADGRLRERLELERLQAAGVELDPRVLERVRFYWTYLGITPPSDPDAEKCEGVIPRGEQSVVRVPNGSRLARCSDDLRLVTVALYCDTGYVASGDTCVVVTCNGRAVGSTWPESIDGGTVTHTCTVSGAISSTTSCNATHDLSGTTCTPKACGGQPHGSTWPESIPGGTRTWSCSYGTPSIASTACAEGRVMQNNHCDQRVSCGPNRFYGDVWIERSRVSRCVVSISQARCEANGTVTRTSCGTQTTCGPDAETDPPSCNGA